MDEAFKYLFTQGVLGVFLVISLCVNAYLYRRSERLEESRYTDMKDALMKSTSVISDSNYNTKVLVEKIETAKRMA